MQNETQLEDDKSGITISMHSKSLMSYAAERRSLLRLPENKKRTEHF